MAIDGALVEHHDVLGEGARLIREDVLHLAQLFVQGGGTGLCRCSFLHAEHLLVPVNEVAVAQTDDFHTAEGTGGEAWGGGREETSHPQGSCLQVLSLGRNRSGEDTWAGSLDGRGQGCLWVELTVYH